MERLSDTIEYLENALHPQFLTILSVVSIALFFLTIWLTLYVIIQLPEDYFSHKKMDTKKLISPYALFVKLVRNLVASILILAGLIMLVLPGQGLLTILIGVIVLDFRKKHLLEEKIMSRPKVRSALNEIRKRYDKKPFL